MSGMGKRFVDAGYIDPKPLIVVDGKPMIQHVVDLFPNVDKITFIANSTHLVETNMREVLSRIAPTANIVEVLTGTKAGPVEVVLSAEHLLADDEEVIVSYCDYGTRWDCNRFLEDARSTKAAGSIACYRGFHPHMLGKDNYAFAKEQNNVLIEIREKQPFTEDRMNEYASNGTYYFKSGSVVKQYFRKLVDIGTKINNEYYVSMIYNLLVQDGLRVNVFEIENMLQWGTPHDLKIYNSWSRYFANIIQPQVDISNPDNTVTILPMAGRGSRFAAQGYDLPKPMLAVNGKKMVVQATNCLPSSNETVFVCLSEHVQEFNIDKELQDCYDNCKVVVIDQTTQGQACTCEVALYKAKITGDSPIMISACDNGVYYNKQAYQELLQDQNVDIIVWTFRNNQTSKNNPDMYAWLDVDENGFVRHVSCKKFIYDDPLKTHAIIGTMFFRKSEYFLQGLKSNYQENIRTNGEFYVDDVLNQNIKAGLRVKVFEVENYICWGTPDDYKTYNYWQDFFDKCEWHPYKKTLDTTS